MLGVNCGFGGTPLKIKEMHRENIHNTDVFVHNITEDKSFLEDLQLVSDKVEVLERGIKLKERLSMYDYIVVEQGVDGVKDVELLCELFERLKPEGYMVAMYGSEDVGRRIKKSFQNVKEINSVYVDRKYRGLFCGIL